MRMNPCELADRIEDAWGDWIDRLEVRVHQRNAALSVARRPAPKRDVLNILGTIETDTDLSQYLHEEASIEATKRVLLGYHNLIGLMRNPSAADEVGEMVASLREPLTLRSVCLAAVTLWPE